MAGWSIACPLDPYSGRLAAKQQSTLRLMAASPATSMSTALVVYASKAGAVQCSNPGSIARVCDHGSLWLRPMRLRSRWCYRPSSHRLPPPLQAMRFPSSATAAIAMVETVAATHRYGRRQAHVARWCTDRPQSLVLIKRHLLRLRRRSRTWSGHATNKSWRIFLPPADILAALREPSWPVDPDKGDRSIR